MLAIILFLLQIQIAVAETDDSSWTNQLVDEAKNVTNNLIENTDEIKETLLEEINKLKDKLFLKGGFNYTRREIKTSASDEDELHAFGFNTSLGIQASRRFEIVLNSYVNFGKAKELQFEYQGLTLNGTGNLTATTFSPQLKYTLENPFSGKWHFYFGGGPAWALQSFKLKTFNDSNGTLRSKHKISYQSYGGILSFGAEEFLPFRQMHPVFIELNLSYMVAEEVSLVDASDFTEVQLVSEQEGKRDFNGAIIMVNFGVTFF